VTSFDLEFHARRIGEDGCTVIPTKTRVRFQGIVERGTPSHILAPHKTVRAVGGEAASSPVGPRAVAFRATQR
jgi:hypothetical protein